MLSITKYLYEGKLGNALRFVTGRPIQQPAEPAEPADTVSTATVVAPKVVGAGIKKLVGETNYGRGIVGNTLNKLKELDRN